MSSVIETIQLENETQKYSDKAVTEQSSELIGGGRWRFSLLCEGDAGREDPEAWLQGCGFMKDSTQLPHVLSLTSFFNHYARNFGHFRRDFGG